MYEIHVFEYQSDHMLNLNVSAMFHPPKVISRVFYVIYVRNVTDKQDNKVLRLY